MEPLATMTDLERRVDWALDDDEKRLAVSALEDASELARSHGGRDWTPERVPGLVRTLVLAACVRYLRNPDGYTQSRAGDETLTWEGQGEGAGTVHFTDAEIELLRAFGGKRPRIYSMPISAWGPQRRTTPGLVPTEGGQKPFPLFAEEVEPL